MMLVILCLQHQYEKIFLLDIRDDDEPDFYENTTDYEADTMRVYLLSRCGVSVGFIPIRCTVGSWNVSVRLHRKSENAR